MVGRVRGHKTDDKARRPPALSSNLALSSDLALLLRFLLLFSLKRHLILLNNSVPAPFSLRFTNCLYFFIEITVKLVFFVEMIHVSSFLS